MIVYFADRHMNILGNASTTLPEGLLIVDDEKTEEIEAGVSVLELHIAYDALTRKEVEIIYCTRVVMKNLFIRSLRRKQIQKAEKLWFMQKMRDWIC